MNVGRYVRVGRGGAPGLGGALSQSPVPVAAPEGRKGQPEYGDRLSIVGFIIENRMFLANLLYSLGYKLPFLLLLSLVFRLGWFLL